MKKQEALKKPSKSKNSSYFFREMKMKEEEQKTNKTGNAQIKNATRRWTFLIETVKRAWLQ